MTDDAAADDDDDPYLYTSKFKGLMANYVDSTSTKNRQNQNRSRTGQK